MYGHVGNRATDPDTGAEHRTESTAVLSLEVASSTSTPLSQAVRLRRYRRVSSHAVDRGDEVDGAKRDARCAASNDVAKRATSKVVDAIFIVIFGNLEY